MAGQAEQLLRQMREDTEECLSIMGRCTRREEILSGFAETELLLRRSDPDHPMAESARLAREGGEKLSEADLIQHRDNYVAELKGFLSAAGLWSPDELERVWEARGRT